MNDEFDIEFERVIFIHKHPTSARTRFLQFKDRTVCGFSPLPKLSQMLAYEEDDRKPTVAMHPAVIKRCATQQLALPENAVELVPQYNMWVDTPGGAIRIHLVSFSAIDPPFAAAEAIGGNFIDLIEARNLPETELLLLRKAYEVLLGG